MHDETQSHVRLLDDVEGQMNSNAITLREEAKHAEEVKDVSEGKWRLYVIIILEIIVFCLLIFTGLS